jgi:DNA polymerase-3 subunit delta'
MSIQKMNLVGNVKARERLTKLKQANSLSHAYLFCGPSSVGKTAFATLFARSLLCESESNTPCEVCESCKLFLSGNNPDFILLDSPDLVSVEEIRELISSLELSPYKSKYKVVVIANFERMTVQGVNSFLKTLEEPTKSTKIILTATNKKNLLPTIVSRTQIVNFGFVENEEIEKFITENYDLDYKDINEIINLVSGRIGEAKNFIENWDEYCQLKEISNEMLRLINTGDIIERFTFAEKVSKDKDWLKRLLSFSELKLRKLIISDIAQENNNDALRGVRIMDKILITKEYLMKNVNTKLAVESLLLGE